MAKLKRDRRHNKKSALLKRLRELEEKEILTEEEENEIDEIIAMLSKKRANRIDSAKLNNNKQDEKISINIKIDTNGGENKKDLDWSTPNHYQSAAGQYRKARIDNRKY